MVGGVKNIDIKSLLIGGLLASTILLGVAAVPKDTSNSFRIDAPEKHQEWDNKQVWYVKRLGWDGGPGEATRLTNRLQPQGFEPFAATDKHIFFRRRVK